MNGNMNMSNFRAIMKLRESFAKNRNNEKVGLLDREFKNRNSLVDKKYKQKVEYLTKHLEGFKKNRHEEKLEIIELR